MAAPEGDRIRPAGALVRGRRSADDWAPCGCWTDAPFLSTALSLLATPVVGGAQQTGKVRRVGIVCAERDRRITDVFEERLREFGHVVGRDIVFEYRCQGGTAEQLQASARELVALPDGSLRRQDPQGRQAR